MKITKTRLRQIIREALTEVGGRGYSIPRAYDTQASHEPPRPTPSKSPERAQKKSASGVLDKETIEARWPEAWQKVGLGGIDDGSSTYWQYMKPEEKAPLQKIADTMKNEYTGKLYKDIVDEDDYLYIPEYAVDCHFGDKHACRAIDVADFDGDNPRLSKKFAEELTKKIAGHFGQQAQSATAGKEAEAAAVKKRNAAIAKEVRKHGMSFKRAGERAAEDNPGAPQWKLLQLTQEFFDQERDEHFEDLKNDPRFSLEKFMNESHTKKGNKVKITKTKLKQIIREARKAKLSEAGAKVFIKNAKASLPAYVAMLKQIAGDPEFRAIAGAGLTDQGGEADEIVTVERGSTAAQNLIPTQAEIGFSNSLADQLKNAYGSTEAALGMKGTPIIMPSPDDPPPAILVWNGKYILDGHHRWSQVMMTNPVGVLAIDSMSGPALKSAEDALKMTQLAIALSAKKVETKPFEGKNLMDASSGDVYKFVYNNVTDEVISLLRQAGKLGETGGRGERQKGEAGVTDVPQTEPELSEEKAKRFDKRRSKGARMAAKYYTANLGTIQERKGKFSRIAGMPQAGKSGTSQDAVNKLLGTGQINYDSPSPEDVKEREEEKALQERFQKLANILKG
jgi:hypothetical protein